jgi:uncharacterized protein YeaO (DUF488 family)
MKRSAKRVYETLHPKAGRKATKAKSWPKGTKASDKKQAEQRAGRNQETKANDVR